MPSPKLIAHRGYALRYPENTLAAVEAALAAGARFVEIDVQLSRDGAPYLLHDRTLERMCGVASALGELTAREIEPLRASERHRFGERFADEPLASLAAFAATIARNSGVHAFVEIKRAALELFGNDRVLDAILSAVEPIAARCTLISFDGAVLQAARKRTSLPVGPVLIDWAQLAEPSLVALRPDVIFCDFDKLPASGPLRAPAPLAIYEVDDAKIALGLAARGVAFIETFQIAEMSRALEQR